MLIRIIDSMNEHYERFKSNSWSITAESIKDKNEYFMRVAIEFVDTNNIKHHFAFSKVLNEEYETLRSILWEEDKFNDIQILELSITGDGVKVIQ